MKRSPRLTLNTLFTATVAGLALMTLMPANASEEMIVGADDPLQVAELYEVDQKGNEILTENRVFLSEVPAPATKSKVFLLSELNVDRCRESRCGTEIDRTLLEIELRTPTNCQSILFVGDNEHRVEEGETPTVMKLMDHRQRICDDLVGAMWEIIIKKGENVRYFHANPERHLKPIEL